MDFNYSQWDRSEDRAFGVSFWSCMSCCDGYGWDDGSKGDNAIQPSLELLMHHYIGIIINDPAIFFQSKLSTGRSPIYWNYGFDIPSFFPVWPLTNLRHWATYPGSCRACNLSSWGEATTFNDAILKFNRTPLKSYRDPIWKLSSNNNFSGAMLNFGGAYQHHHPWIYNHW